MTDYFFTGCHHFNHTNIIDFCNRPFESKEHMHDVMIERWNSKVKPGDIVYHHGDFFFTWDKLDQMAVQAVIRSLNGQIFLIKGNHDRKPVTQAAGFAAVLGYKELKIGNQWIIMCHYPFQRWHKMHKSGNRPAAWHTYSHCHGNSNDLFYPFGLKNGISPRIHVGVDSWDFYPVSFDELGEYIHKQANSWRVKTKARIDQFVFNIKNWI